MRNPWPAMRRSSIRIGLYGLALLTAVASLGLADQKLHWHQQLHAQLLAGGSAKPVPGEAVALSDYRVVIDAKPIAGISSDLSGITYDFDRDRLLAVTNDGPPQIVALSKTGDVLARYPLEGFVDTEGIAYVGGGRVALASEVAQQIDFIELPVESATIRAEGWPFLSLGINAGRGNKGFEGVAYAPGEDRLFIIKERDPRQLYEVDGAADALAGRLRLRIRDLTAWIDDSVSTGDLADVCRDEKTGHLILLSEESKELVELDGAGRFASWRPLAGAGSGLARGAPSPEGVAMDRAGNLYVVSEPNLFYVFRKD